MLIVDDELLALILRFGAQDKKAGTSNEDFLRQQVQTMRRHLAQFPREQHARRAMEWVQGRAADYRRSWQNREVGRHSAESRCKDCPLRKLGAEQHCEVHEQWLYLLQRYIAGEIGSKKYVRKSLKLLKSHKKQLKHRVVDDYAQWVSLGKVKKIVGEDGPEGPR
jgi:ribosomal protein S15P/S13E